MIKLNTKKYTYLLFLLLLFVFVSTSCNSNDSNCLTSLVYPNQTDTTINLSTSSSDIHLELGQRAYIIDIETTLEFLDVLEHSNSNSVVLLQVEYFDLSSKTIELNTKYSPQTYTLENGYYCKIKVKNVIFANNGYEIIFSMNRYFYL